MGFKMLPVQKKNVTGNLEIHCMIWVLNKHNLMANNSKPGKTPGQGEKSIRFFHLYFSITNRTGPLLLPHLMSNTIRLLRVIQPWYLSDIHVKYLKDLPYTWLGKYVHIAANARMLVISMCLTCADDDTVYLDGERHHAVSFTMRMEPVPENG